MPGVAAPVAWLSLAASLMALVVVVILPLMFLVRAEPQFLRCWLKERRDPALTWPVRVSNACDAINIVSGQFVSWLVLVLLLEQFLIVILRYVFSWGSIEMQESIMVHARHRPYGRARIRSDARRARPPLTSSTTASQGGVRRRSTRSVWFSSCLPLCIVTWWLSWDYVVHSWEVKESSTEGSGLPWLYLFKTLILLADAFLAIQAVSLLIRSLIEIRDPESRAAPEHSASHGS